MKTTSKLSLIALVVALLFLGYQYSLPKATPQLNNRMQASNTDWIDRLAQTDLVIDTNFIFGANSILGFITTSECRDDELPAADRNVYEIIRKNYESLNGETIIEIECLQSQQIYERAMQLALSRYKTLYNLTQDSVAQTDIGSKCCTELQKKAAQEALELWQSLICKTRDEIDSPEDAFFAEIYWRIKDDSLVSSTLSDRCAPE